MSAADRHEQAREDITRECLKVVWDRATADKMKASDVMITLENIVLAVCLALGQATPEPYYAWAGKLIQRLPEKVDEVGEAVARRMN